MALPIALKDRKANCLRWLPNESYSHAHKKFEIAYYLRKHGWSFYSECNFDAPFKGRADLVAVQGNRKVIIEVIESEKALKESKKENYPEWEIISIQAKEQFTEEMLE